VQDRPTSAELLATLGEYLEEELMPALDGPLAYRTRVAANLVRILERENALGPASLRRERELLSQLLGVDPPRSDSLTDDVLELNRQVVDAIDAGRIDHTQAWPALMEIARAKLAIIRPGYDAWDSAVELP